MVLQTGAAFVRLNILSITVNVTAYPFRVPFKFTIVIFFHYKPRIAAAILGL